MDYFHGTTTALGIVDTLSPPSVSEKLTEVGRKKNLDKVFFTRDRSSALIYARKAVKRFGGSPVVFKVAPEGDVAILQEMPGTSVLAAPSAKILSIAYIPDITNSQNHKMA